MIREKITPSPKERFFPDPELNLEEFVSRLEKDGSITLTKNENGQVLTCEMRLDDTSAPTIYITASIGNQTLEGFVATPLGAHYANLRKAWYGEEDERKNFEGRGIIKLATVLLMIYVYKKYDTDTFQDFSSNFSPLDVVFRSRPEGIFGEYQFTREFIHNRRVMKSTIKKVED